MLFTALSEMTCIDISRHGDVRLIGGLKRTNATIGHFTRRAHDPYIEPRIYRPH
jgi:hypothetical protein